MYIIASLVTSTFLFCPQRKLLIATSLIVAVSLFVVVANYSEKPYFRLQPMFRQGFSSHWMFSKQPYKGFKPHLGYVSIPKQEVRGSLIHSDNCKGLFFGLFHLTLDLAFFSMYCIYLSSYIQTGWDFILLG